MSQGAARRLARGGLPHAGGAVETARQHLRTVGAEAGAGHGGLVQERSTYEDSGVPILKDIPIINYLFKQRNDEINKDHLLIFITPRIVRSGTPTEIEAGYPSKITFADVPDVPDDLAEISRVVHDHGRTTLETEALQTSLSDLLAWAAQNDVELDDLDARSPSLETVFLSIADGREQADDAPRDTLTQEEEGALR